MIRFDDRVAIVTGAGVGLGRCHALGLAERGAKVVVNDLGASTDGASTGSDAAQKVVAEIEAMGGEAIAHGADVSNADQVNDMVAKTMEKWGRIDILINNAGILRDKTFGKMTMDDFRKVVDVHLIGTANCCHAVWPHMRAAQYGRIVVTTSASGLYGNFGQSNYGAAKAGVMGLMNVLHLEGARDNIRVNTLAPTAATRMTENLMPPEALELLKPETITPGVLYLVSEDGPSRKILGAGAGHFALTRVYETAGALIEGDITPEAVAAQWDAISAPEGQEELNDAFAQTRKFALSAAKAKGIKLDW
ncbi:SDR family NAD(P)-dependent oxidoreductase [Pseudosulfitobacter pseudonitzschiae]|uniref:SDR family NAD(P)-dependent oxidoreductase n=1 Tax=Pseudosulfitobacter pseudonitzschiae TaxID=1402135 RepID=UPI001AF54481|nr:SDR family NAD(P)-dependent oxidoreductase [Pseudosulfitobacter pseudonitzschiae]MBM1814773.1 SDR family NAD(P)-dependent oxidoreductase [Pseudosulfitobacter pseudonitzschiae]MBM1831767.1 SDR family NAD(P)-dependent oxidoreductase [Pseudosulfitobacter pseudonitzschiae]MBM1836632.1 SDR family NAD(P)-dependent oxidoreductase [Pseudosulfitobacter pseudonitzschiae]MBM1841479.1 SDR family NAD(P)-dependent oxidoreductase [Pseudosulfitobacter pseudonitzschiae]MBM1846346.1 SDR family NAD(P)-depende